MSSSELKLCMANMQEGHNCLRRPRRLPLQRIPQPRRHMRQWWPTASSSCAPCATYMRRWARSSASPWSRAASWTCTSSTYRCFASLCAGTQPRHLPFKRGWILAARTCTSTVHTLPCRSMLYGKSIIARQHLVCFDLMIYYKSGIQAEALCACVVR